jgi:hypothetical protein
MKSRLVLVAVSVVFSATVAGSAPPESQWTLPRQQAESWANRVRKLTPEGWSVTIRNNDIVIQRDKPVHFAQVEINAPPRADREEVRPKDLRDGSYRLTLRFTPKLSLDEYERLAAVNAVSSKERSRLAAQTRLTQKFGDLLATTPEEDARLKAYQEAVAKLPWHDLPDLYTPDHGIILLQSWSVWSYIYDKDDARECREVRDRVLIYFGMYDPAAAVGMVDAGSPEP